MGRLRRVIETWSRTSQLHTHFVVNGTPFKVYKTQQGAVVLSVGYRAHQCYIPIERLEEVYLAYYRTLRSYVYYVTEQARYVCLDNPVPGEYASQATLVSNPNQPTLNPDMYLPVDIVAAYQDYESLSQQASNQLSAAVRSPPAPSAEHLPTATLTTQVPVVPQIEVTLPASTRPSNVPVNPTPPISGTSTNYPINTLARPDRADIMVQQSADFPSKPSQPVATSDTHVSYSEALQPRITPATIEIAPTPQQVRAESPGLQKKAVNSNPYPQITHPSLPPRVIPKSLASSGHLATNLLRVLGFPKTDLGPASKMLAQRSSKLAMQSRVQQVDSRIISPSAESSSTTAIPSDIVAKVPTPTVDRQQGSYYQETKMHLVAEKPPVSPPAPLLASPRIHQVQPPAIPAPTLISKLSSPPLSSPHATPPPTSVASLTPLDQSPRQLSPAPTISTHEKHVPPISQPENPTHVDHFSPTPSQVSMLLINTRDQRIDLPQTVPSKIVPGEEQPVRTQILSPPRITVLSSPVQPPRTTTTNIQLSQIAQPDINELPSYNTTLPEATANENPHLEAENIPDAVIQVASTMLDSISVENKPALPEPVLDIDVQAIMQEFQVEDEPDIIYETTNTRQNGTMREPLFIPSPSPSMVSRRSLDREKTSNIAQRTPEVLNFRLMLLCSLTLISSLCPTAPHIPPQKLCLCPTTTPAKIR